MIAWVSAWATLDGGLICALDLAIGIVVNFEADVSKDGSSYTGCELQPGCLVVWINRKQVRELQCRKENTYYDKSLLNEVESFIHCYWRGGILCSEGLVMVPG